MYLAFIDESGTINQNDPNFSGYARERNEISSSKNTRFKERNLEQ